MTWCRRARVASWLHFLALPLAGFDSGCGAAGLLATMRGVVIAAAVLGFGYALNGYADRRTDHPSKRAFTEDCSARSALPGILGLAVAALVACSLAPRCVQRATALALFSGASYSVGPRLKRFPVVGSLANLTNFVPLLWVGVSQDGAPRAIGTLAVAFACLLVQNQLIHEAADLGEDLGGGVLTSGAMLGPKGSAAAIAVLGLAFSLAAAHLGVPGWLTGVVFVVVIPVVTVRWGRDEQSMARLRLAHRVLSVVFGAVLFGAR